MSLVLVVSKPWIRCPDLITQDLLLGKSTADVSSVWKGPTSNVELAQITISPPEISSSYQFPYGTTKVTWTASNSEGSESCSIFVIIYGMVTEFFLYVNIYLYIYILVCRAFSITSVRTFISAIKRSLVPIYYCTGTVRRQQILPRNF